MTAEFRNEPFTDFTNEQNAQAMREAIEKVKAQLGREYPLVIGGERITTEGKLESINPANRTQVVGRFNKATKELATRAVDAAFETFKATVARGSGDDQRGCAGAPPAATSPVSSLTLSSIASAQIS